MTVYPATGTNIQFNIAKVAAAARAPQHLFHMLFTPARYTHTTLSALRNARVLLNELQSDIAALRAKADKVLLKRGVTRLSISATELPLEKQELFKAQSMVHHLKHTKNSIDPERLN